LHQVISLNDLAASPGNHVEALQGDWKSHHGIRINDQYRVASPGRMAKATTLRL
jgi:plasmid maintenance system killer protein